MTIQVDTVTYIQIDENMCRGCQACALACSLWHEGECSLALARILVTKDMATYTFDIKMCRNCQDPPCVPVCPSGAMVIDAAGNVLLVEEDCTRCGACAEACPYNAIFYNEAANRYLKCDLCASRPEGPLCTELCPVGALTLSESDAAKGGPR